MTCVFFRGLWLTMQAVCVTSCPQTLFTVNDPHNTHCSCQKLHVSLHCTALGHIANRFANTLAGKPKCIQDATSRQKDRYSSNVPGAEAVATTESKAADHRKA